jgi:hypothetical protein
MELLIPILIVAGIIAILYIALDKEKKDGSHPLDTVATPKTFPPVEAKEEVKEVVVEAPKVEDVPMTLTVDTPPYVVETPPIQQDKPKAKRGRKPAAKTAVVGKPSAKTPAAKKPKSKKV